MHLSLLILFLAGGCLILWQLCIAIYVVLRPAVRGVPGPYLARFSRLWFLRRVHNGQFHHENIQLHRKYGSIVQLGPDLYSLSSPDVINQVYAIGSKFAKSDWYDGWKHPNPNLWTLFPDRNLKRHAQSRRVLQGIYSMSSLVSYEQYVDECATILGARFDEMTTRGLPIDMTHWLQCYAFDVIGNMTFSQRFGFLDRGEDVSGILSALHHVSKYSTLAGIVPFLHPYLYPIMNHLKLGGASGRAYLMKYVLERISQRKSNPEKVALQLDEGSPQDFLDKLIAKNKDTPTALADHYLYMMSLSNIIAGSDTTAISLSAVFYYLMKNPRVLAILRKEVDEAVKAGQFATGQLSFKDSLQMPYLQAVIKEALRLHPATGLPLWRVVPEGGAQLDGKFFPAGTNVGINTWCAHYSEEVFGADAKQFRPERWLEAEEEGGHKLASMNAYYFPFGLGSRTCIGRHISYLEMSKLVPLLVKNYDFELEQGRGGEWDTINYWFVKPVNFWVRVKARAT